jgi:hypothetical protein
MDYSISSSSSGVSVVISPKRNLPLLVFVPLWTGAWLTLVIRGIVHGQPQSILGIAVFSLVTAFLTYSCLWNLAGREQLEFTATGLACKRILFGISSGRMFSSNKIEKPHFEDSRGRGKSYVPSGIGFSYAGKEIRVGDDLTSHDAKKIIATVVREVPSLERCWGSYSEGFPFARS